MKIKLSFYPPRRSSGPGPIAVADCEARITAAQIIVHAGTTVNDRGIRVGVTPQRPMRFRLQNGRPIPYYLMRHSWEIDSVEFERIKEAVAAGAS